MIQPHYEPGFVNRDAASFNPYELTPLMAMNRRMIIELPGVDHEIVGQRASLLLSKTALIGLIQKNLPELDLEDCPAEDLPKELHKCLVTKESLPRQIAENILATFGRRLGYLIASILISQQGITSPVSGWEQAFLSHWRTEIDEIILGGGLVSGKMGEVIIHAANQILADCGLVRYRFTIASQPVLLPLIGAARAVPHLPFQVAAVADFGSSYAKCGLAWYDHHGAVERMQVFPTRLIAHVTTEGKTCELADMMVETLAGVISHVAPKQKFAPIVTACVAGYIHNNRPALFENYNMGPYSWLNQLSDNLAGYFGDRIAKACGRQVEFKFIQDGDAAAISQAGFRRSAVLMLGSFIGMGFVPPSDHFRPLSHQFQAVEVSQD